MSLATGTRLGPYEIVSLLGAGGMGEVYRAHDRQLKRDVALKMLPPDLALAPDRLARFDREAQALAALNHPHIAQVYGIAHEGDVRAIIMELVEGPTLADRIARAALPPDEALPIAIEIADALEYAHEHSIVHRDLKPANIKITPEGAVKVLDFGLAKALVPEAVSDAAGASPTMTSPAMTRPGVILGTAAYMAPEQARGAPVDRRADIWAFGVVLFEMLTGASCFAGETVTDVLAAVVKTEPDWTALPPDTSWRVREVLQRCLAKDRKQRLRDIGDARLELEKALAAGPEGAGSPTPAGSAAPFTRRQRLPWALASASLFGLACLATAVLAGLWPRAQTVDRPVVRFHIMPPAGIRIPPRLNVASISPDARAVAFVGEADKKTALWVRPINAPDADAWQVPGSEGAVAAPFWKPDGSAMAFAVPGILKAVDIASRTPRVVCPLPAATDPNIDGAWSPRGEILFGASGFGANANGVLFRVSEVGGSPGLFGGSAAHDQEGWNYPQFLSDGRLLTTVFPQGPMTLRVRAIGDAAPAAQTPSPVQGPAIAAEGYLVYGQEDVLVARRFDQSRVSLGTEASVITPGVQYEHLFGWLVPAFSVSQNGALLYREGSQKLGQFSIVDRRGTVIREVGERAEYFTFSVSDDGATIVAGRTEPDKYGLWKIDSGTGKTSLLTPSKEFIGDPTLGRPGFVTFAENMYTREVWEIPIAGGTRNRLLAGEVLHDRTRDGEWLLVSEQESLRARPVREPSRAVDLVKDGRGVDEGRFSPDGRSVAYNSAESGRFEVYVVRMPPTGEKLKVSMAGGVQPQWRADGRELYYLALDGTVMAVDMDCPAESACKAGVPHALFATGIASPSNQIEDYATTGDGQRFVILKSSAATGPLTVLLNWPEIVKKK